MIDRSFMNGIGYIVFDSQWELLERIVSNIENNYKTQTVLAPNAGGKTSLSILLAVKFCKDGYRVLHYTGDAEGANLDYISRFMRTEKTVFNGITFAGSDTVLSLSGQRFDYVIMDAAHHRIPSNALSDKKVFDEMLIQAEQNKKSGGKSTPEERSIMGMASLAKIIKECNSYVVSFDLNKLADVGYTPVLASGNVITNEMTNEEFEVYSQNVNNELDKIFRSKKNDALRGVLTPERGRDYDNLGEKVLTLYTQIDLKLEQYFASINKKLDSIQDDIQTIKTTVREIESSVKDRKKVLELFFSTEPKDERSTELFVTKISTMIADEINSKIDSNINSQTYHMSEQLVYLKMGEAAIGKMSPESIKFLVTARYLVNQNMNLGEEIDYSSVCLLASKAFELELSKRFVTKYQEYLRSRNLGINQWPSEMKKTVPVGYDTETVQVTIEDFTLGKSPYIMGFRGKREEKEGNKRVFKEYCRNALMKGTPEKDIEQKCKKFDNYIKNVKDKYRNPAAHKSTISLEEAVNCLEYILEVEKVLKIMLEAFSF